MLKISKTGFQCAVDIGTNKIICIIFRYTSSNFEIISWSHKKNSGMKRSSIIDLEKLSEDIYLVVKEASKEKKINIKKFIFNITDLNLLQKSNYSKINIGGFNVTKRDIRRLFKKNINDSLIKKMELIHSFPCSFNIDGEEIREDPEGKNCFNLGLTSSNVWVKSLMIKNLENSLKKFRIIPDEIFDTSLASAFVCIDEIEKRKGCCCIDFGAGSTKITVYYKNNIKYIDYIPYGGNDVTNDIHKGLNVSKEFAEYIKVVHGNLIYISNKKINVNLKNGDNRIITQNLLQGIIKPRYEEIFEIIRDYLEKKVSKKMISSIILTGGASQINGLSEFSENILNRKTRLGAPKSNISYFNNKPEYSTLIGLIKLNQIMSLKKLISKTNNNFIYEYFEKLDSWIKESIV